ncbi:hypothetical protein F5Y04DRAFT_261073 [Hypomontagnella monticulosa]|nr:hypothetical protein F5Y04DRAFT_261073 [Hypomontagnella monticulosa]
MELKANKYKRASIAEEPSDTCKIPSTSLVRVLEGVVTATKSAKDAADRILQLICGDSSRGNEAAITLSFKGWLESITTHVHDEDLRQIANVALAIAYLRELYKQPEYDPCEAVRQNDLTAIWRLIRNALISETLTRPLCTASRSAQGFLSVALCSLIKDGNIDELFRLHVWLPDGKRGNQSTAIHSHQCAAQSWILAGKGVDYSYEVEHVELLEHATHAEYALAWSDGKNVDTKYKVHQTLSTVVNTGILARATLAETNTHRRGASYVIPAAKYHVTEVSPQRFHATLFVFDSHRGFVKDAGVLGPRDAESFTQLRDPAGETAAKLARMVDVVRHWEVLMDLGQQQIHHAEWENALATFNKASVLCNNDDFPNRTYCQNVVLLKLGRVNRCFGRYEISKEILERVLSKLGEDCVLVDCSGELGVVYRHLGLLADAKRVIDIQYTIAKKLNLEAEACRAIGNLGMVNYQLSRQDNSDELLDLSIAQFQERIRRAEEYFQSISTLVGIEDSSDMKNAINWKVIGLSRLSLCFVARGSTTDAIKAAQESLTLAYKSRNPTVIAISCFVYGHALMAGGRREEAIEQFNAFNGCTPAIAFCAEPTKEHREYLREVINAGVDLDILDGHGYSALDYAVFNGDTESEGIVLQGLKQKVDEHGVEQRRLGALLRKGYRELFQEKLRPVLSAGHGHSCIQELRSVYADSLATDREKREMFLGFSYIPYSEFSRFGRIPRFDDELVGRTKQHVTTKEAAENTEFIIFFSYRWIGKTSGSNLPDDDQNTQYKRMLSAAEDFLKLHPTIGRDRLGIWVDYACIDQDDPLPGAHSLPLLLMQCDAVISLADGHYSSRAWCSVEALLVQVLKKSYGVHLWYEQVHVSKANGTEDEPEGLALKEGPIDLAISIGEKSLTFEEIDRPKVMFLERQSRLLG